MAILPVVRADALARPTTDLGRTSLWGRLELNAALVGDRAALAVDVDGDLHAWTWTELSIRVRQAGAGLLRAGLRGDQVVLSLLPPAHRYPEIDLALRAIGAVVVAVSPRATPEHLARELDGVDVRLVLVETSADLDRLRHVPMPAAQLLALADDGGWERLLDLGAERLRMDPGAVDRADATVDQAGAVLRMLAADAPLVAAPEATGLDTLLPVDGVALMVGEATDPLLAALRDAHLQNGCTLTHGPVAAAMPRLVEELRPSVLALSADETADAITLLCGRPPSPRRRRPVAPQWAASLRVLVAPSVRADERRALLARGIEVVTPDVRPGPASLPVPPVVRMGDVQDLPRRARQEVADEFALAVGRATTDPVLAAGVGQAEDAVLPSLPLFSGESFLDKLLLARAEEARA